MNRLLHKSSSYLLLQEEAILKLSEDKGFPVVCWWERILLGEGLVHFLPGKGEMLKCPETHGCRCLQVSLMN